MKKKIISLCLVVVLALTAIGGATLAYFTDDDKQENNFTIGNIDIKVDEKGYVWDKSANDGEGGYVSDAISWDDSGFTFSNLMPSYIISKRPWVENLSTRNDAYVRVAITVNNYTKINDAIDNVYEAKGYGNDQMNALYDEIFQGWGIEYTKNPIRGSMSKRASEIGVNNNGATLLGIDYVRGVSGQYQSGSKGTSYMMEGLYYGSAEGQYYEDAYLEDGRLYVFYLKLEAGKTYQLFNGLNIPADFTNEQMAMFENLHIGIYADAIQTVGFANTAAGAKEAFEALEAEHPIGWWNET